MPDAKFDEEHYMSTIRPHLFAPAHHTARLLQPAGSIVQRGWLALAILILSVSAQAASAPTFEVASIKPTPPGSERRNDVIEPTERSLTMRNVTLATCIKWAYKIQDFQLTGPDWLNGQHFDIVANSPGPVATSDLRVMLQQLLADRFKLEVRKQSKEMQALAIVVEKNGPKFSASTASGESGIKFNGAGIVAQRATLGQLAEVLSRPLRGPVVDLTGLTGEYDFKLDLVRYQTADDHAPAKGQDARSAIFTQDMLPLIGTGLHEQLGLKLESRKASIDVLQVEHAERLPSGN
jgi:uncharacterized protein (TIGR03435 family)